MRTIKSGLTYQASASSVNNTVSSVPKRLSSSCRDRWVSDFPIGGCLTSRCLTSPGYYGLSARRVAYSDPSVSKAPTVWFPSRVASIATGWSDPVAEWELHPLKIKHSTVHGSRNDMSQNCVKKSVTIPADHGTSLTLVKLC